MIDALRWKYLTTKSRITNSAAIAARAPFVYRTWCRFFFRRGGLGPGILDLRNGLRFHIRPRSTDRATISEVFAMRTYSEVPSGAVVVDIGANVGAFALGAALRAEVVYALEPVTTNFIQLQKNVVLNALHNVHVERLAVAGANGEGSMSIDYGASSLYWGSQDRNSESVRTITLETFLSERAIDVVDYLKMDCEGAEWDTLLNTNPAVLARIRHIEMEYHFIEGHKNVMPLVNHLTAAGFKVTTCGEGWNGGLVAIRA